MVPEGVDRVWLRAKVRTQWYAYEYSFDGETWTELPVRLDARILSDDYVNQTYGGFFTGASWVWPRSTIPATAKWPPLTTSTTGKFLGWKTDRWSFRGMSSRRNDHINNQYCFGA